FFFSSRGRHTRSDRDWSSDVCSSDLAGTVDRRRDHQRENGDGADRRQEDATERHEAAVCRGPIGDAFPFRPTRRAGRRHSREGRSHDEIQNPSVSGGADRESREKAQLLGGNPGQHGCKGEEPKQNVFALDAACGEFCLRQWSLGTRKTTAYSGIQVTMMKYQKTPSNRASRK